MLVELIEDCRTVQYSLISLTKEPIWSRWPERNKYIECPHISASACTMDHISYRVFANTQEQILIHLRARRKEKSCNLRTGAGGLFLCLIIFCLIVCFVFEGEIEAISRQQFIIGSVFHNLLHNEDNDKALMAFCETKRLTLLLLNPHCVEEKLMCSNISVRQTGP